MGLPTKAISVASGALAILLTSQRDQWSTSYMIKIGAQSWAILFVGWGIYRALIYPHFLSPLIGLPEPSGGHWLMGQMKAISSGNTGGPLLEWATNIPNNGLIRYWLPPGQERVLVTSAKGLSEVLVTRNYDFEKPAMLKWSIGRILGNGLLFAEGDEHKRQRKNLMPAFAFRHVKDLYPVFWGKSAECVRAMTEQIRTAPAEPAEGGHHPDEKQAAAAAPPPPSGSSSVMEVGNWASRATLDIIGIAGLGRDFGAIRDPDNELNQTYRELFAPSKAARMLQLLNLILPGWLVYRLPVKRNGDVGVAAEKIRQVCRELVQEKAAKLREAGGLDDADVLSVATESGGFSEEGLVDQMMTFLAAGHETTASAMQWAVYMLCLHPEVQMRLREEVRARLPSPEAHEGVAAADIDRMPYLNAVCSEVLRYYPPAPMTLRQAVVDTSIDGVAIPRGTTVILCPWAVNRLPSLWGEDAARFNPDRWLRKGEDDGGKAASVGGAASNYAFLTFLHGPRSCIGQGFAKAEFACLLASWVGRFEFELRNKEEYDEKNMEIKGGVTARPANGLWVVAKVLDGW